MYPGSLRPLGVASGRATWLICCPHAGGTTAFFRDWPRRFPPAVAVVPVQYPGHGDRLDQPCVSDVHELSRMIAAELVGRPDVIVFGHSFGAAVAFELAVRLAGMGSPPRALLISARGALDHQRIMPPRTDEAIWQEMVLLGGTPAEIAADPEWRELLTPQLRADFHADAAYRPSRIRLACPVTALFGRDDEDISRASIDAWREYIESEFAVREFPGGHFYLADHVSSIAKEVERHASAATRHPGARPSTFRCLP